MRREIKMWLIMIVVILSVAASLARSESNGSKPPVLMVTLDSIHRVQPPVPLNLQDRNHTLNYRDHGGGSYVNAIDFNHANKSFCYIQPKVLFRASELRCTAADYFTQAWTLPSPKLFASQFSVSTMARDWASGAWYFADRGRRLLYVCDSSLQHCRVLRTDIEEPLGLAVDPTPTNKDKAGFMFWSQNNTSPSRLVRGSLAADDLSALLPRDCSGPCAPRALTLDVANKKVFWIDGSDVVAMCNYDGSGRRPVYKIPEAYNRDVRAFSEFDSTIYMPGYRSLATVTLDLEDPSSDNITETYTNVFGFPTAAVVYHGTRQPAVSHPCMENNGGCAHICVTAYEDGKPAPRCLCRHGFEPDAIRHGVCNRIHLDSFMLLAHAWPSAVEIRAPAHPGAAPPATSTHPTVADVDTDTELMYFSDTYTNRIIRQKLDGTEREDFIKDEIYECQGLAIDWMGGNLYWTDEPLGRVSVARLSDPTQRRELVRQGSYHPYSIVLDPARGIMYWSVWARGPASASIDSAHMDGSARRELASEDLEWPNGLVLDTDKQVLYWCDTKLNKIESLELANNKRSIIIAAPGADIKEPYGLTLVDGDIVWSEKTSGLVRQLSANGNVTTIDRATPPVYDIRVITRSARSGRNACSVDNGGCTELCLATPEGLSCACSGVRTPDPTDPTRCVTSTSSD